MTEEKRVSVIVPVFNAVDTLERSIRSLINQTLLDLEIIVVNDASTDGSLAIMQTLAAEHSNLIIIDVPENKGVHEARLVGIAAASSAWVGFLDADDIAKPKMYETMYKAGVENAVDVVACGSYRVTPEGKRITAKVSYGSNLLVTEDLFERYCAFEFGTGILWNKLFSRKTIKPLKDLHFPWRQNTNEDLLLNIGIFLNAKSLFLVKDMLHEYTHRKGSVTSVIGTVDAFVDTYRAYAVALTVYAQHDEAVLRVVTSLYRKQLEFSAYRVKSIEGLYNHSDRLQEAIDVVSRLHPIGLALLAVRSPVYPFSQRVVRMAISRIRRLYE